MKYVFVVHLIDGVLWFTDFRNYYVEQLMDGSFVLHYHDENIRKNSLLNGFFYFDFSNVTDYTKCKKGEIAWKEMNN